MAKARSDREQLVAALYADARYEGVVTITIDGKPLDDLPPDAEFKGPQPMPVAIVIAAGPKFTLGNIRLEGDAAGLMSAEYGLIPGGDAGSGAVLKAEALIVRTLKEEGRPLAKITDRQIVADHATSTLDVTLTVAAGPVAGYGATTVEGTEKVDRDFTEYMTGLKRGKQYSPRRSRCARPAAGARGVQQRDVQGGRQARRRRQHSDRRPGQRAQAALFRRWAAPISNTEGLGLEGYWGHRNLFGRAEKLRIEGAISGIGSNDRRRSQLQCRHHVRENPA